MALVLAPGFALVCHAANPIVVGQVIDLSGPNGSIGRDYVAGITTFFDSLNTRGGLNGRKITYVVRDDRGNASETARLATALIRQDRAEFLLGGIGAESTAALVATPAFAESRHMLFAPLADSASGPRDRVVFWRPSLERELLFILDYFQKLGIRRVGIALQDAPQHRRAYAFLKTQIARRGMQLAGTAHIGDNPAALDQEARQLGGAVPKLVIAIADTVGAAQFLKAFRKADPVTFVAGSSRINLQTLAEIAGPAATEWTVFSQVVPNPGSTVSVLQKEHMDMMKKFRDEPVSSLTLEGFAVAKTLVRMMRTDAGALQQASASRASIDLGGLTVVAHDPDHNLSRYVDIALFKRGGGLTF